MKIELSTDFENKILFSFICIITIGISFFIGTLLFPTPEFKINYINYLGLMSIQLFGGIAVLLVCFIIYLYVIKIKNYLKENIKIKKD